MGARGKEGQQKERGVGKATGWNGMVKSHLNPSGRERKMTSCDVNFPGWRANDPVELVTSCTEGKLKDVYEPYWPEYQAGPYCSVDLPCGRAKYCTMCDLNPTG